MEKQQNSNIEYIDHLVSNRLKHCRKTLGYKLEDIAKVAGVSVQQIMKYENCTNRIPVGRLYFVAKMMKMPINYFLGTKD